MALTAGELNVEIGAKLDKLDRGLKDMDGKLKNFRGGVNQLNKAFAGLGGAIAGAFAVDRVLRFGNEAIALAGKMEGVQAAFDRLNNPNLLLQLRHATRGTISDLELMQQAVRAENFKVPLDQLATFFEFATKRAAQTGESVDYLVNSIIDGIGRKSTLVMDNLGISATELQEEIKKTGDFGEAAGNIIQRELGKAGDVALTTAQKTAQLNAQLKNQQAILGKALVPAYIKLLEVGNEVVSFFSVLFDGSISLKEKLGLLNPATAALTLQKLKMAQATQEVIKTFEAEEVAAKNVAKAINDMPSGPGRPREEIISLQPKGLPDLKQTIGGIIEPVKELNLQWAITDTIVGNIANGFFNLFNAAVKGTQSLIQALGDLIKQLIATVAKAAILAALMAAFGFGSFSKLFGQALGFGFEFGGERASGGPVNFGQAYLVGERGPELFMPGRSGSIMPNNKLGMMGATVAVGGRLLGQDILISNARSQQGLSRQTGR